MIETAGFDVVGEMHLETIVDLVNMQTFRSPLDGMDRYLLGGPFSVQLALNMPAVGQITLRFIIDCRIEPLLQQGSTQLLIDASGGSSVVLGRALRHLEASIALTIPMGFMPDPNGPDPTLFLPTLMLSAAPAAQVTLGDSTGAQIEAILGVGSAPRFASALGGAIGTLLGVVGDRPLGALGFRVLPGVASADPMQLSAAPQVAWIDTTTLGVFGYYRADPGGGDVARKTVGDLAQTHEEFFYDQPGVVSIVPGRRVAVVMSSAAFGQVIVCPNVRHMVVNELLLIRDADHYIELVRNRDGDAIRQQLMSERLVTYLLDEERAHPERGLEANFAAAKAHVERDVTAEIARRARQENQAWLDSPDGQAELDRSTPPDCGSGAVEAFRKRMPDPLSDLVAMLRRFQLTLHEGFLRLHAECDGDIEVALLGVHLFASVDVEIRVSVDELGHIAIDVQPQTPFVEVDPNGFLTLIVNTILSLITGPAWGALFTYVGLSLGESIAQKVIAGLISDQLAARFGGLTVDPDPQHSTFPSRAAAALVETAGIAAIGLIGRHPHWNEFAPGFFVEAAIEYRDLSDLPPDHGTLVRPRTKWGCSGGEFPWTRTFWDTTISVTSRSRDLPLPITITNWRAELGNFTYLLGHAIDPRPVWSGSPVDIVPGTLVMKGTVFETAPPTDGRLELRDDVQVGVGGDAQSGWRMSLRAQDANFYLRLSADAIDGDENAWSAETFIVITGDELWLGGGYAEYKADCDRRYRDWFRLLLDSMGALEVIAVVEPGQPVEGGSELISAIIGRTLVTAGDPIAIRQMSLYAQRFGPAVLAHMGVAQPLALRKVQAPAPGGTGCDGDSAACCSVRGAGTRARWCCCPACTKRSIAWRQGARSVP